MCTTEARHLTQAVGNDSLALAACRFGALLNESNNNARAPCVLSFCSDDALEDKVCVVPVLEVR